MNRTCGLALIALATVAFVLTSCRPRFPPALPSNGAIVPVEVSGGSVLIENLGCPEVDLARARAGLEAAWQRGVAEEPRVEGLGWSGLHFIFDPRVVGDDSSAYYDHTSSAVYVACGTYEAIDHYPGHHWCIVLGRDCCTQTWHETYYGRDLQCGEIPGRLNEELSRP